MILLDGKKLSQQILDELKDQIKKMAKPSGLAIIMVGEHPATLSFIKQKEKACEDIGIRFNFYKYPEDISTAELRNKINIVCKVKKNTGVIIQLPVPDHINKQYILNTVPPEKDVDVLAEKSLGKFYTDRLPILPPTIAGIMRFLKETKTKTQGTHIVIVGAGGLVGKPLATHMINQGATVSILNEFTSDIAQFTKEADVLVTGVGKPGLITDDMVKEGVIVIDAGLAEAGDGKITGDVDFKSVSKKASYITPVPGGVGPMTVAMLLKNLVELAKMKSR